MPTVVPFKSPIVAAKPPVPAPARTLSPGPVQPAAVKTTMQAQAAAAAALLPPGMQARYTAATAATPTAPQVAKALTQQAQPANQDPMGLAASSAAKIAASKKQVSDLLAKHTVIEANADKTLKAAQQSLVTGDPAPAFKALTAAQSLLQQATQTGTGLFTATAQQMREGLNQGALKTLNATPNPSPAVVAGTKKLLDMRLNVPLPSSLLFDPKIMSAMQTNQMPSWVLGDVDVGAIVGQVSAIVARIKRIRPDVTQQLVAVSQALAQGADSAMQGQFRVATMGAFGDAPTIQTKPYSLGNVSVGSMGDIFSDAAAALEKAGAGALANLGKTAGTPVTAPKLTPTSGGNTMMFVGLAGAGLLAVGTWFAFFRK